MKKVLLSVVFGIAVMGTGFAQQGEAENLSVHKVQMGETVMVLAKKYKITPRDIYEYNPSAVEGLSPNMALQIPLHRQLQKQVAAAETNDDVTEPVRVVAQAAPVQAPKPQPVIIKEEPVVAVAEEAAPAPVAAEPYKVEHEVQSGETLSSLSRKYHTSVAAIEKENAGKLRGGLKAGQTLNITAKPAPVYDDSFIEHKVASGETLNGLSRKYNTTVAAITDSNKSTLKRGLQAGQTLMIQPGDVLDAQDEAPVTRIPPLVPKDKRATSIAEMMIEHQVKNGETLSGLAHQYNTTVDNILNDNKSELSNGIQEGQILKIKEKSVKDEIMAGRED